jgi:hypothetical protein
MTVMASLNAGMALFGIGLAGLFERAGRERWAIIMWAAAGINLAACLSQVRP